MSTCSNITTDRVPLHSAANSSGSATSERVGGDGLFTVTPVSSQTAISLAPCVLFSVASSAAVSHATSSFQSPTQTLRLIPHSALHPAGDLKPLILRASPIAVQDFSAGKFFYFYTYIILVILVTTCTIKLLKPPSLS